MKFTPQMDSYVRQQLELEREPWWVATELARMAKVDQSVARSFVDTIAREVRPGLARSYLAAMIVGLLAVGLGVGLSLYLYLMGWITGWLWLAIPAGAAFASAGWYGWKRHRRRS